MKSVDLKSLTQEFIDFDPRSNTDDPIELISLATSMTALRSVLLSKLPKVLQSAIELDPEDYFPYLQMAKYYAYDRPDKTKSQEYAALGESKMRQGGLDTKHPHFSDLSLVQNHWSAEEQSES